MYFVVIGDFDDLECDMGLAAFPGTRFCVSQMPCWLYASN